VLARARWELLGTTVGLEALMALSGLVLSGWVFLHMLGNLLVFAGPETMNGYAATLAGGPILWAQRVVTVVAFGVHVTAAVRLTRRSWRARPRRYARRPARQRATASSRSMRWGGLAVGLFVLYHVAHIYGPLHRDFVPGDVHHNLVSGLSHPLVGGLYVLATLVFGLHLHHGTWSLFRSLGHDGPFETGVRRASAAFTALVTAGFLAPCVAALAGWV
jgi:succinate dehydrogenase / fumarate reductase cytochrome b subunit